MTPELWEKVQAVVDELLDVDPDKREARILEACDGDEEMEREVRGILEAEASAKGMFRKIAVPEEKEVLTTMHFDMPRFDHYRIIEKIGVGGMGIVYRAIDGRLDREVALKFLSPHFCDDETARARFLTEAKVISTLDHPNVCIIHDIGETDDRQLYFSMPFYQGKLLKDIIQEGKTRAVQAAQYTLQILQGAQAAHRKGIVHRDIKPANVLVTEDNVAKLLDFGVAKGLDSEMTRTGQALGTMAYMAPEQLKGEQVDARADIWSIGVIFYELLTTVRPFGGDGYLEVSNAILKGEIRPVSEFFLELPEAMDRIVGKCLAIDREKRYRSAQRFIDDLEELYRELQELGTLPRDKSALPTRPANGAGPSATSAGTSGSSYSGSVSETLEKISAEFGRFAGPSARLLVNTISPQCSSMEELSHRLAMELPDERDRDEFLGAVSRLTHMSASRGLTGSITSATGSYATDSGTGTHTASVANGSYGATGSHTAGVPVRGAEPGRRIPGWAWGLGIAGIVLIGLVSLDRTRYFVEDQVDRITEVEVDVRGVHSDRVVLGMTGAFSGLVREAGRAVEVGIDSALSDFNEAGGAHGREVEIKFLDDGFQPEQAIANLQQMLKPEDGVFALLGNTGTPTAEAILDTTLEQEMVMFGTISGAELLRKTPPDRFVFNYRASDAQETEALVRYYVEHLNVDPGTIGVFYQNDVHGLDGLGGVDLALEEYGVDGVAVTATYESNTTRVEDGVQRFVDAGEQVSVIIVIASYEPSAMFTKGLRDGGYQGEIANISFVGSRPLAEQLMAMGPEYGDGVVVSQVVPYYDSYAGGVLEFREAMARHHPNEPLSFLSLEAYIATRIFLSGLEAAGRHLTTDTLIEGLYSLQELDLGIGPTISFGPSQHQASNYVWGTRLTMEGNFEPFDLMRSSESEQ